MLKTSPGALLRETPLMAQSYYPLKKNASGIPPVSAILKLTATDKSRELAVSG
jgi:hypothetical protein